MARTTIHIFKDINAAEAKKQEHGDKLPVDEYDRVDIIDSREANDPKTILSERSKVYIVRT